MNYKLKKKNLVVKYTKDKDSVIETDEKDHDYQKLEGIWTDNTNDNKSDNNKSLSIRSFQPDIINQLRRKYLMDITKEKIFNAIDTSISMQSCNRYIHIIWILKINLICFSFFVPICLCAFLFVEQMFV
eukprot:293665_1